VEGSRVARQLPTGYAERIWIIAPSTLSRKLPMIAEKLAQIQEFLAAQGIKLQVKREPPVGADEVTSAKKLLGRPLPIDLKDIYLSFANGFELFWQQVRSETDWDFARFALPPLEQFVTQSLEFHRDVLEQQRDPENYFVHDLEKARQVLARMLNWGVLWDTCGDGNKVCIDLESGAVLFHEREWPWEERYINGYLIASSLSEMIEDWGNVCFLNFEGCPGSDPTPGGSAVPDYARQRFNMMAR
jgi:SMI1/KNR4 family protein SUKH-1